MGAETFMVKGKGKNAAEAFETAREKAFYDYGHAGYTGSIAEKHSFTMIPFNGETSEAGRLQKTLLIKEIAASMTSGVLQAASTSRMVSFYSLDGLHHDHRSKIQRSEWSVRQGPRSIRHCQEVWRTASRFRYVA